MSDTLPVEVRYLYPIPVARYRVSDEYLPLLNNIIDRCIKEGMESGSRYRSKSLYILNDYPEFKQYTTDFINDFMRNELGIDDLIKITQSWVNRNAPHQSTPPHPHPNSIISGCIYLNVPENESQINFFKYGNDNGQSTQFAMLPNYKRGSTRNPLSSEIRHTFKVNTGDIVMFPSYLMHGVLPTNSRKDRWSLAFNSMPTICLGSADSLTEYRFS
jgi:uncharacterized protein (TIGR02466 family)